MAQIRVRLDDDVMEKLQQGAQRNGRSIEEEVREILRDAVKSEERSPVGLGSRLAATFRGVDIEEEIQELRGYPVVPIDLDS